MNSENKGIALQKEHTFTYALFIAQMGCVVWPRLKSFRREGYPSLAYFAAPFPLDYTMLHRWKPSMVEFTSIMYISDVTHGKFKSSINQQACEISKLVGAHAHSISDWKAPNARNTNHTTT